MHRREVSTVAAKLRAVFWRERKRTQYLCKNRLQAVHIHIQDLKKKEMKKKKSHLSLEDKGAGVFFNHTGPKQTAQQWTFYFRKDFPKPFYVLIIPQTGMVSYEVTDNNAK